MSTPKIQPQEVQSTLAGQPVGSVTTSHFRMAVGAREGGAVDLAQPGKGVSDRVHPRAQAPNIPPPAVHTFLDRDQELGQIGEALARGQVVDLNGPDGAGKTALISQAMRRQLARSFPDGLVYLHGKYETSGDVLQELFKHFYDTDGNVKVTEDDMRRYMSGKRVLIAVDDLNHLAEREAENIPAAVPGCRVLIAGRKQQAYGGVGVTLRGLPREQAVALFEKNWGQVSAQERPTVEAICQALDDIPLAIVKIATATKTQRLSLAQVLAQIQAEGQGPVGQAFGLTAAQLSQEQRRALGGLAAPGGQTVGVEALAAITRIPAAQLAQVLQSLQQMGLVYANSPRYSLDEGLVPYYRGAWASEGMRSRAADYYMRLAPQLKVHSRDPDERNVMAALGYYYRRGAWQEVVYIARAVDRYLATSGRWGQWAKRLNQAWQAAKQLGDRATEAWAQNQLGLIAMGLGNYAQAVGLFKAAFTVWQALGDKGGMTISQWNMQVLAAAPPPLKGKGVEKAAGKAAGAGGTPTLPLILAAAAAAILVIGGVILFGRNGPVTPTDTPVRITPSPTPTHTPTPTVPELSVDLAAGCGEEYHRDGNLTILLDSNVNGTVDVSWVDPQGNEEHLFQERVARGRTAIQSVEVPDNPGEWRLEAELNSGAARDTCEFAVGSPDAQVQVWLEEGCGRTYLPGESLTVLAQSNLAGNLVVEQREPSGQTEPLLEEQVAAGQVLSQLWSAPETAGAWLLRAELADSPTPAEDECAFDIMVPEVSITLEDGCDRVYDACQSSAIRLEANVSGEVDVVLIDSDGGRQFQYSERLFAGQDVSESWDVPSGAGDWTLEAVLDGGAATELCGFSVDADSAEPVIHEVWVEPYVPSLYGTPQPPGPVCPGDKVWVYAQTIDACGESVARAELSVRDASGSGEWQPIEMDQVDDQNWQRIMTAQENPGIEFRVYVEDNYGNSNTSTAQVYGVDSCAEPISPTVVFYASPESVTVYDCATLYWDTQDVAGVHYQGQQVGLSGSEQECCEYEQVGSGELGQTELYHLQIPQAVPQAAAAAPPVYTWTNTYELQVEYLDGTAQTFTADVICSSLPQGTLDDGLRDLLGEDCVTSSEPHYYCPYEVEIWYPEFEPFRAVGEISIPATIKALVDYTNPLTRVVGDADLSAILATRIAAGDVPSYLVLVYPQVTIDNLDYLLGSWPQYHHVYYWNQANNTVVQLQ